MPKFEARPELVRARRIKRKIKAAASIMIALSAGAFLACQRGVEMVQTRMQGPDAAPDQTIAKNDAATDGATDAMEPWAGKKPQRQVDKNEHRKGMPVPDNLLE